MLQFSRLKHILLKNFRNECIHIILTGMVNMRIILDYAKILIDNNKIVFSDGSNQNIIIDINYIEKIKILSNWNIILTYKNLEINIQQ